MTEMLWIGYRVFCANELSCLHAKGVRIETQPSFDLALEQLYERPPDVLVLSLTGEARILAAQVIESRAAAPNAFLGVIVASEADVELARRSGADDAVSLETKGDKLCYPVLLWADHHRRGVAGELSRRTAFLERRLQKLENQLSSARADAVLDEASGLPGRKSCIQCLDQMLAAGRRHRWRVSVCVVEFRGLSQITDVMGDYLVGGILGQIGRQLVSMVREGDMVARIGPERFALLMPASERSATADIVSRIREDLGQIQLPKLRPVKATISASSVEPMSSASAADVLGRVEATVSTKLSIGDQIEVHSLLDSLPILQ